MDASQIPAVPTERSQRLARRFAAMCISMDIVAAVFFGARMWTRNYPAYRMSSDDYVCALAFAFLIIDTALFMRTVSWIFGSDVSKITLADVEVSFMYGTIGQPFWAWAMAAIKCSVGLMLLRLEQHITWRRFLWGMIALQVVVGVYNTLAQVTQCIPLNKAWDLLGVVEGKCWPAHASKISSIIVQVIHVLTDWVFALLPISFLRKVQRPLRERVVIGALMALGIFAGVASVVKIVLIVKFEQSGDTTADSIQFGVWSCVEELIGFIAACVPCLRGPFQRVLERFGIVSTRQATTYNPPYANMYGHSARGQQSRGKSQNGIGSAIRMKSLKGADAQSEEHILTQTGEEVKSNEIWCTTEVTLEEENGISHGRRNNNFFQNGQSKPSYERDISAGGSRSR